MKKLLSLAVCGLALSGIAGNLLGTPMARAQGGSKRAEQETRLRINLTGPAINGRVPGGNAEWRVQAGRKGLKIEASNVNLPDNTMLTFTHNGKVIGIQGVALGRAQVELRSQNGGAPPNVTKGDVVAVWNGSTLVVSGKF